MVWIGLFVRGAFLPLLEFLHGLPQRLGQLGELLRAEHEDEDEHNDPPLRTSDIVDEGERGHDFVVN